MEDATYIVDIIKLAEKRGYQRGYQARKRAEKKEWKEAMRIKGEQILVRKENL